MQIKFKQTLACPRRVYEGGKTYDVDDTFGAPLVERGVAEQVEAAEEGEPKPKPKPQQKPKRRKRRATTDE